MPAVALLVAGSAVSQNAWSQQPTSPTPLGRWEHVMAYDAARGVTVMFGGYNGSQGYQDDTWTFDGTTWQAMPVTGARPSPRGRAAMCYDSLRHRVILVAGQQLSDTWLWDGSTWSSGPGGLTQGERSVAYDSVRDVVVAHDGNLTHEWSGTGFWVMRSPAHSHSGGPGAMAFDVAAGKSLLFADGQTWTWDGVDWQQRQPAHNPPSRMLHRVVYESLTGKTILFGGYTNTPLNDTWAWDGTDWTQQISAGPPSPRHSYGMAYDPLRQRVVLFGGTTGQAETWLKSATFTAPATVTAFGAGCPGSAGMPQLQPLAGSLPWIGSTLQIDLQNLPWLIFRAPFGLAGFSNTQWGSIPLPFDLTPIGMPGCQAFVDGQNIVPLVNNFGLARWSIPIPYSPYLVGVDLYLQGLLVDPGVNAFGMVDSNALACRIGAR